MPEPSQADQPVILFDGACNLCNAAVRWVVRRDRRAALRFASLQSQAARRLLAAAGTPDKLPDSMVFVDAAGVHTRSDAALRIARRLGWPWSLTGALVVVPRPVRDALYDWVARNRYRWFGRRDACRRPASELRSRFLDADEPADAAAEGGEGPCERL